MTFREIFRFEFRYQVARWHTWLYPLVISFLVFLLTRENFLADALYDDFYVNAPFVISFVSVFGTLVWILAAGVVAGEATGRDIQSGIHPLLFTTPISKQQYLGGRFLAALCINLIILLAVPAGILIAVYAPGVDPVAIGPFRPGAYLRAFAFITMPNAFVATAIQFSFSALSRKTITAYLGSFLLFFMAYVVSLALIFFLRRPDWAKLTDPVGVITVVSESTTSWTPYQKNTRMLRLEGPFLWNRVLWMAIAILVLLFTFLRFRLTHPVVRGWFGWLNPFRKTKPEMIQDAIAHRATLNVPQVRRNFGFPAWITQTLHIAGNSLWLLLRRRGGVFVLGATVVLLLIGMPENMINMTVPLLPRTVQVLTFLTAPLGEPFTQWIFIPLVTVIYAGELIWREREAGVNEMTDTSSVPEWSLFLGKFTALAFFLAMWMGALLLAGVLVQLRMGYDQFEPTLYCKVLFGLQLPEYLLFATLVFVIQVLVNQKYIAHLVCFLVYALICFASPLGIHHHLLLYGTGPQWSYTDMRGFGNTITPWAWFKLYWAAWAVLLAVVVRLFWVRGATGSLRERMAMARGRLTRATKTVAVTGSVVMLTAGGFVFYNTNILHDYHGAQAGLRRNADYEKAYKRFEEMQQVSLARVSITADLYPKKGVADIHGRYQLINRTAVSIDTILVTTLPGGETGPISLDRQAQLIPGAEDLGQRVFHLQQALQPGESVQLEFLVKLHRNGFSNSGIDEAIAENGTHLKNVDYLPVVGYDAHREIINASERRTHGLPQHPLLPPVYALDARNDSVDDGVISFEATVSTDADQIAVAPGALQKRWSANGRNYFHYATNAPMRNEYAISSARYALKETVWKPAPGFGQAVTIQLYYHPGHAVNLDRIIHSVEASMDFNSRHYGPYPHNTIRIVERPGTGMSLHAELTTIDYQENFSLFHPSDDPEELDLVFAIVAHEAGHQWWGGQLSMVLAEGSGILTESLAWYASMGAVEATYGDAHLKRLMKFMRQPYPVIPVRPSVPLLQGFDPYTMYRRGPFALHALGEYIGRPRVDSALKHLIKEHPSGYGRPATSLSLYRELEKVTPDSTQYLLRDLFKTNTFWDLSLKQVSVKQVDSSLWQVTLRINAGKQEEDSTGRGKEIPMQEWIELGIFPVTAFGDGPGTPIYLKQHLIRTGEQEITVTVPIRPARAAIDPYHLLFDWNREDNYRKVKE
ncbi:ABC transporter permease/M1 family aminopeptidase [Flavihumibacter petaseus]|uniref:Peptidase M1 membrane alanine aminopeptidase domain-containing protein n=1 Tax=Flavihumibacter petaseus NBRC 106054 TaxID=1220578 RepID=A0A0E9MWY4_9BACT|nr:ABC transporter permease [Flavihumibacter petaseus]GAO41921.1 hypothetical protein FPE01S_01_09360 [Flavihumibacter petaseus NBRC 106054]